MFVDLFLIYPAIIHPTQLSFCYIHNICFFFLNRYMFQPGGHHQAKIIQYTKGRWKGVWFQESYLFLIYTMYNLHMVMTYGWNVCGIVKNRYYF